MYFMVTGSPPFSPNKSAEDERASVREKHIHSKIPNATAKNPLIPTSISHCIAKCLAKIPERRFQSISSLEDYLDNHKNADPILEKWEYLSEPRLIS